jgi:hypothetical protein
MTARAPTASPNVCSFTLAVSVLSNPSPLIHQKRQF